MNGALIKKNYDTRNKSLRYKGLLPFLTPSALSVAASEYQAVENDRVTPDSGRCWNDFWRPLGGCNAPEADFISPGMLGF
jgi:hypothetical protein